MDTLFYGDTRGTQGDTEIGTGKVTAHPIAGMERTPMKLLKKPDGGGYEGRIPLIRLMTGLDYAEILRKTPHDAQVTIFTYGLSGNIAFYIDCLRHFDDGCCTLVVSRLTGAYEALFTKYLPNIHLIGTEKSHAKMILISPDRVYLSSQNFYADNMFQHAEYIEDSDAYEIYRKTAEDYLRGGQTGNYTARLFGDTPPPNYDLEGILGEVDPDYEGLELKNVLGKYQTLKNWNGNLNSIRNRDITISTFTIPSFEYAENILRKLIDDNHNNVTVLAHPISKNRLEELAGCFDFDYRLFDNIHAKIILCSKDPDARSSTELTLLSSQNFGSSGWFENAIRLKGSKAYHYYMEKLEKFMEG